MNRVFFWGSTVFWVLMMSLLIRNDILPLYVPEDNPGYDAVLRGIDSPKVREMVVYKDGQEVGTSSTTIVPRPDGSYSIQNGTSIEIPIGPAVSKIQATAEVTLDKDKEFDRLFLSVNALGVHAGVSGQRVADKIELEVDLNGQIYNEELPYERGVMASYFEPFAVGSRLRVGQVWHTKILDPMSRRFTTAEMRVVGKETIELSLREGEPLGKFDTYKIVMDWGTTRLSAWATEKGEVLKQETPLGYTLVYRETEDDDSTARSVEILRRQMRRQRSNP